ncbi:MAG: hypothetical protein ACLRQY_07960, partial [[Clostridium] leptum]
FFNGQKNNSGNPAEHIGKSGLYSVIHQSTSAALQRSISSVNSPIIMFLAYHRQTSLSKEKVF